jgi:hypothetical protein
MRFASCVAAIFLANFQWAEAQTASSAPGTMRIPPSFYARQVARAGQLDGTTWESELIIERISPMIQSTFALIQRGRVDISSLEMCLPELRVLLPGSELENGFLEHGLLMRRLESTSPLIVNHSGIPAALAAYRAQFETLERTEFDITSVDLGTIALGRNATLRIEARVTGMSDSRVQVDHLKLQCDFLYTNAAWLLRDISVTEFSRTSGTRLFSDVTNRLPELPSLPNPGGVDVGYFAEGISLIDFDSDGDLDILVPRRVGSAALLENRGDRGFVNVAATLGIGSAHGVRSGYFFDWDNDGDLDLLLLTRERMWLFAMNDGAFHDSSRGSMFDRMFTDSLTGAAVGDYDNDGLLDFFVCNYGDPRHNPGFDYFDSRGGFENRLFHNEGNGTFKDATASAGLDVDNRRWTYAALWIDYNEDRKPDLYIVNDYGPNQLLKNDGNGRFADVAMDLGAEDFGSGMGASWADYDNDGLLDLYVSNMHSYPGERLVNQQSFSTNQARRKIAARYAKGNTLLKNTGVAFREVTNTPAIRAGWAWGNLFFDYDNDGDQDLYVANGMYSSGSNDAESVFWRHVISPLSNYDPGFRDGTVVLGYKIMMENASFSGHQRNCFFQNVGNGEFASLAAVSGADLIQDSRSVAAGDIDNDGDLDLVISNRNFPFVTILENQAPAVGNYLRVRLIGRKSNRMGIGSRISAISGGGRQVQEVMGGTGYLSQSPAEAWFGFGHAQVADFVEVRWSSGTIQTLTNLPLNRSITIRETD